MYTYAFLKLPSNPLDLPQGIVQSVQLVSNTQLAAIVEPALSLDTIQQDNTLLLQAVLAHDRVIRELFRQTTILPLRFGTCFTSLSGLLTHLESHEQTYLCTLARITNKIEYTLKLMPRAQPDMPIDAQLKGKDYFLAKKRNFQAQLEQQQQGQTEFDSLLQNIKATQSTGTIHQVCYADSAESTQSIASQDGTMKIYLLSDRSHQATICQQFSAWQRQCPNWELTLEDGLPPYHFLEQEL